MSVKWTKYRYKQETNSKMVYLKPYMSTIILSVIKKKKTLQLKERNRLNNRTKYIISKINSL